MGKQMLPNVTNNPTDKHDPDLYFPLFTALQVSFFIFYLFLFFKCVGMSVCLYKIIDIFSIFVKFFILFFTHIHICTYI